MAMWYDQFMLSLVSPVRKGPVPALLALTLAFTSFGCSTSDPAPTPPAHFVLDDQGRALILHGVNVANSSKHSPDRVPVDFDASDAAHIAVDWDFNFVRYLILWDALEPSPGMIDSAYLDRIEGYLDLMAAENIHVLIDMHQDVYSADFCCDGAPSWAIRDDGQSFELQDSWFLNYYQPAVVAAFDNFFDYQGDHPDLQDHYADAWAAVAARFKDHPAVLGYDLMNEPFSGSYFDQIEALTGGQGNGDSEIFDNQFLGPFYQRLIDRIRQVDPDSWIFFEPRYGAPGNGSPSHLPHLDDPRVGEPRLVYAPHLYSVGLEASGTYTPEDQTISKWEIERGEDLLTLQTPLVLGEWGIIHGAVEGERFITEVLDLSDRMGAGWSYWSYDPGGFGLMDSMGVDRDTVDIVVRPYPRAVAGRPLSYGYEATTRVFTLVFEQAEGVTGPTEISIPAGRHYPGGWELVTSDPEGSYSSSWDASREVLEYTADPASYRHTLEIRSR